MTYRRYTNFAIESIEQTFNGQADFGRRVQCVISRNGDLAYRTYLQVTLPEINQLMGIASFAVGVGSGVYARWLDYPGEQIIAQVEVEIGGQRIDRQYGDWMHIWNQLTMTAEQQRGYFKMIGNTTQLTFITDPSFSEVDGPCDSLAPRQVCAPRNALPETTLYVPLQFWFCTNPGLALPLIALKSAGQKSTQPKTAKLCFGKNLFENLHNSQVLVVYYIGLINHRLFSDLSIQVICGNKTKLREVPKDDGYQAVNESLQWLRKTTSGMVKTPHMKICPNDQDKFEMDNPQPSY